MAKDRPDQRVEPWQDPKSQPYVRIEKVTKKFGDFVAVSDAKGEFVVPGLTPGKYTLTVSLMGFKTFVSPDVDIQAATPASAKVTLQVGELAETVLVTGVTDIMQTQSATVQTTLLRMLAGFEEPTAGRIFIDGVEMTGIPPYERPVNMMFQSYAVFPHMTVEQNVAFGLKQENMAKAEIAKRVGEMLDLVRLGQFAKRKPHQLSGGHPNT